MFIGKSCDGLQLHEYKISVSAREELELRIGKINKRAEKIGADPIILDFYEPYIKRVTTDKHTGRKLREPYNVEMIHVSATYTIPVIAGWTVMGVVEPVDLENKDNIGVIALAAPGEKMPQQYHDLKDIHCDHCGFVRRRKQSVLLRNSSGEHKLVGSTCLKDFLGHDPGWILMMAEWDFERFVDAVSDDFEKLGYVEPMWDLESILRSSSACIRKFGWRSRGTAYEYGGMATADYVSFNLEDECKKEFRHDGITEYDIEMTKDAIEYWSGIELNENDYRITCNKLASIGFVKPRYLGFACSMISSYINHLNRETTRRQASEAYKDSDWQGMVGDRLKGIEVECTFQKDFDSDFGISTLYAFIDGDGNLYKTFYSGSKWDAEREDKGILTGTVKKHDNFNGTKQTVLTRCIFERTSEEKSL